MRQARDYRTNRVTPGSSPGTRLVAINTPGSSGQALDHSTRAYMEPRFGRDFSQVRVHANHQASESAAAINAQAYTVGNNIVLGAGQTNLHSDHGRTLMAHELTHVVQQQQVNFHPGAHNPLSITRPNDAAEREADTVAQRITSSASERPQVNRTNSGSDAISNYTNRPAPIRQMARTPQLAGRWIVQNPSTRQVKGGAKNEKLLKDAFKDICNTATVISRNGNREIVVSGGKVASNRTEGCGCLQTIQDDVDDFRNGRPSFLEAIPQIHVDLNGWSFTNSSKTSPEVGVRHPEDPFGWGYWSGADARKQKGFFRTVAHEVCGHMSAEVQSVSSGRGSKRGHNEAIIRENRVAGEHGVSAADQRGLDKSEGGVTAGVHRGESFLRAQIHYGHNSVSAQSPAHQTRVLSSAIKTMQFFATQLGRDVLRVQLEGFALFNEAGLVVNQRLLNVRGAFLREFATHSISEPFPDPANPKKTISRFARDISTIVPKNSRPNTSNPNRRVDIYLFHKSHSAR